MRYYKYPEEGPSNRHLYTLRDFFPKAKVIVLYEDDYGGYSQLEQVAFQIGSTYLYAEYDAGSCGACPSSIPGRVHHMLKANGHSAEDSAEERKAYRKVLEEIVDSMIVFDSLEELETHRRAAGRSEHAEE